MGRGPAWRSMLRNGIGTSGRAAVFLIGMAAAILLKLATAGGEVSDPGVSPAQSGVVETPPEVLEAEDERPGRPRPAQEYAGQAGRTGGWNGKAEDMDRTDAAQARNGMQAAKTEARNGEAAGQAGTRDEPLVRVYLAGEKRVETVPLEAYVRGVVAGEMPADFELEALKAQAIAARTYIIRKLLEAERDGTGGGRDYDVTDGEGDQVYIPLGQMRRMNLERRDEYARFARAAADTEGLVLVYGDEPILAVYFSTSGGYTEDAEDYWSAAVPYLQSVPSPWDAQLSPRFEQKVEMPLDEFYERLGIGERDRKGGIEVLSRTEGRSVKKIRIGKRVLTGRKVREALELPSANFSLRIADGRITLICRGHGHGVGMSQWGAQALALAGNDAESILAWYYRGARIARVESLAPPSGSFKT